jgi:hypothetical protein
MPKHRTSKKSQLNVASSTSEIVNFYDIIPKKFIEENKNPNFEMHNIEIPFRMCIVAPSGSGKTNFLLNLIKVFSNGQGTFTDITIVTRNKDEPLYNYLSEISDQIQIKEGMSSTPKLDDFEKQYNHLVVWDDLVLSKNLTPVEEYYIRARKKNCSVIFLSQSYYDIPKMIRKNSSYLTILNLGGSKRETTAILNEWSGDLDKDELRAIYNDAVSVPMRPLIITGGKVERNKKYRKGWKDYYELDTFLTGIPRESSKTRSKKQAKTTIQDSSSDSE